MQSRSAAIAGGLNLPNFWAAIDEEIGLARGLDLLIIPLQ
jgi:hypothetical protein